MNSLANVDFREINLAYSALESFDGSQGLITAGDPYLDVSLSQSQVLSTGTSQDLGDYIIYLTPDNVQVELFGIEDGFADLVKLTGSDVILSNDFGSGGTDMALSDIYASTFRELFGGSFLHLSGGKERDELFLKFTSSPGEIWGMDGNDRVQGGDGNDILFGDDPSDPNKFAGRDLLKGLAGSDRIEGGAGWDKLYGGDGWDSLKGQRGSDRLYGENGNDWLYGGEGRDFLWGGQGDDHLRGGDANDHLRGNSGNDNLMGGRGRDTLYGNEGDDILNGGPGEDILIGGKGNDIFVFNRHSGLDIIRGFEATNDLEKIDLTGIYDITDFNDLKNNHMTQVNERVIISDRFVKVVALLDTDISDLGSQDFLF